MAGEAKETVRAEWVPLHPWALWNLTDSANTRSRVSRSPEQAAWAQTLIYLAQMCDLRTRLNSLSSAQYMSSGP